MDNNPLKQYFRRPSVYIKLPSNGTGYPENAIDMPENGELPVYPMTAIDEITVRTPDALFNGTAIAELIRSCIPCINDPWAVTNVDLDAILVAIKTASSASGTMELDSTCPKCEDTSTYSINLAAVLSTIGKPDFDTELDLGDLKVKLKPLSYKAVNDASLKQFEFQRVLNQLETIEDDDTRNKTVQDYLERVTDLTMDLLSQSVEYIQTPASQKVSEKEFILDFLKNCDRNLYTTIRDHSAKLRAESEIKPMTIACPSCGNQFEQTITLNPADFFA